VVSLRWCSCQPCAFGSYTTGTGSSSCFPCSSCSSGQKRQLATGTPVGAARCWTCVNCLKDYQSSSTNLESCVPCPAAQGTLVRFVCCCLSLSRLFCNDCDGFSSSTGSRTNVHSLCCVSSWTTTHCSRCWMWNVCVIVCWVAISCFSDVFGVWLSLSCEDCPINTFTSVDGLTSCSACAVGQRTLSIQSTSCSGVRAS